MQFVRFRGSSGERLVHLSVVVEVIPMVRLTSREHHGNQRYCGMLHFRGRVIPVFDLDHRDVALLDNPDNFLVVTRQGAREQAIVASEIGEIIEAELGDCTELDTGGPYTIEVVDVRGVLLEVIDPERLAQ